MRVRLFSDLHLEFSDFVPPTIDADVIILAGDIHTGKRALPWIEKHFSNTPVLYLMGNHEYYHQKYPDIRLKLANEAPPNVTIMENTAVEIAGYRILGCTLWTDFSLHDSVPWSVREAMDYMADYKYIRSSARKYAKLIPQETMAAHNISLNWLKTQLEGQDNRKTIIATHHAPSGKSIGMTGYMRKLDPAYASNLDSFIEEHRPLAWLHGHTHETLDYMLDQTRIISNPGGYRPDEQTGFDMMGVFEL